MYNDILSIAEYEALEKMLCSSTPNSTSSAQMLSDALSKLEEREFYTDPPKKKKSRMSRMEKQRMYGGK